MYDSEFATDDLETDSQASPVVDDDAFDDIDDDGNEGSDSVNLLNRSYSPRNSETDNFRLYLNDMGQYKVLSQKEETELARAYALGRGAEKIFTIIAMTVSLIAMFAGGIVFLAIATFYAAYIPVSDVYYCVRAHKERNADLE